jgi:hypothetical protein
MNRQCLLFVPPGLTLTLQNRNILCDVRDSLIYSMLLILHAKNTWLIISATFTFSTNQPTSMSTVLREKLTNPHLRSIQEIPRILRSTKVHYRIHNSSPPIPVLSLTDQVHAPYHFSNIHFNSILSSIPASFNCSPYLRLSHQNPVLTYLLSHRCYMSCLSYSS